MQETTLIPLQQLRLSELNVRKDLSAGQEDADVEQLAASIRSKGLLQPLTVRSMAGGNYEVIVGQRRLLACQHIGHTPVLCVIRDDLNDSDAATVSLIENVQRADMHPLDKAKALQNLYEAKGSFESVAKETGWGVETVKRYMRLLSLPQELQDRLSTDSGSIGVGSLSQLAQTFSGDDAVEAYDQIAGFTGKIQGEIIKRSGGDLGKIGDLVLEAQEGAFNVRKCGGRFGCEVIREILEGELSEADFELRVKQIAEELESDITNSTLSIAASSFWKALATE
ncbi:MAG: ParB/RepB/Spo0J family partition protein [Alphaproteobacteria bacterium]|nr:ParB/RepB/Spo0J family partition protein [Alphaproteobacteria bacterium]MDE2493798.1 ParB/RepB/Spo0J family partition protein [Alphaproteobacteria bacterium]